MLVSFFNCTRASQENLDLSNVLAVLGSVEPKFIFAYPGRDVTLESKEKVKNIIIHRIRETKNEIQGFVYGFNDLDVLIALREARNRGVKIVLRGDKEEDYSLAESFGFTINRWRGNGIHHLKVLIFDQKLMFLGTGNFTTNGLLRDNNVFWLENLTVKSYKQVIGILNEEESFGIWDLGHRKMFFAPQAGYLIQDAILEGIRSAKLNVRYMIYTHYDPLLSYEIMAACKRGVKVEGIYNEPVNPEGELLSKSLPFPCKIYADGNVDSIFREGNFGGGLLHHKTILIDHRKVLVGSYNFTVSARDENREFYTEFEDPASVEEFLGEWARVKNLSKLISVKENSDTSDQKLFHLTPSIFSHRLLLDKSASKPFFNKNSSGLSKELISSLNLIDTIALSQNESFNQTRDSEEEIRLPAQFDWLNSELKPIDSFSILMFWNKIQIQTNPKLDLKGIYVWDGKKNPIYFPYDPINLFPLALYDYLKTEQWVVFVSENGYSFSCTQKKNMESSRWIQYLRQKQLLNGFERKDCTIF
jgi:hypothetical protein